MRVIESPHPYLPNTDEEIVVTMPGATYLTVTFDERCRSVPTTTESESFAVLYNANS
jgi:hypothetical protein